MLLNLKPAPSGTDSHWLQSSDSWGQKLPAPSNANKKKFDAPANLCVLVLARGGPDEGTASLVQVVQHDLAEPVLHVDLLVVDDGRQRPKLFWRPLEQKIDFNGQQGMNFF